MQHVTVVMNSSSGGLLGRENAAEEVAEHLRVVGLDARIIGDADAPDLMARLDLAIAAKPDAVIVGGGDGTICAAAQRLAGTDIALGILPLGTMNMLAKDLGIPLEMDAAAETLGRGHVRAIDVAEVNGRVFLCNSVLGLPTALGRHRERHRGETGLLSRARLLVAAFRTTLRHMPLHLRVAVGDEPPRSIRTRALVVANNAYDEGFGQVFTRTRLDRGELLLYRARDFGVWWGIKMLAAMALGAWRRRPELDERATDRVTIHSRRPTLRVMSDGEAALLTPPLVYRIRPHALRVIVPATPEGEAVETAPADAAPARA